MTQITEHHREQEGERDDGVRCRIHFTVRGNTISVDERLESVRELIGPIVSRWILKGLHSVQNGRNRRSRAFLEIQ